MHVRGVSIKLCNGLHYVWRPVTCEESEVYTWYARRWWGGWEFKLLCP